MVVQEVVLKVNTSIIIKIGSVDLVTIVVDCIGSVKIVSWIDNKAKEIKVLLETEKNYQINDKNLKETKKNFKDNEVEVTKNEDFKNEENIII